MLDEERKLQLLALSRIEDLKKSVNLKTLLSRFNNSPEEIFKQNASSLAAASGMSFVLAQKLIASFDLAMKHAGKQMEFAAKNNFSSVTFLDEDYPANLLECADFPPFLFYKGKNIFNDKKYLSVVGTRNADDYGKQICRDFIKELAAAIPGLCIVSGLAYGIDVCAHNAALESGVSTIAVMAGGLSYIYPKDHKQIASEICDNGAVISEFDFEEPYFKTNFLQRNRIIAGFSVATIVVESAIRGGSLSTANLASSYNRDVFAFPGRAGDKLSEGCNKLIRDNKAALITGINDFLYFIPWENPKTKENSKENKTKEECKPFDLTDKERQLYDIIKQEKICHKDSLMLLYPKSEEVNSILLGLEFKEAIKSLPGNFYEAV